MPKNKNEQPAPFWMVISTENSPLWNETKGMNRTFASEGAAINAAKKEARENPGEQIAVVKSTAFLTVKFNARVDLTVID